MEEDEVINNVNKNGNTINSNNNFNMSDDEQRQLELAKFDSLRDNDSNNNSRRSEEDEIRSEEIFSKYRL